MPHPTSHVPPTPIPPRTAPPLPTHPCTPPPIPLRSTPTTPPCTPLLPHAPPPQPPHPPPRYPLSSRTSALSFPQSIALRHNHAPPLTTICAPKPLRPSHPIPPLSSAPIPPLCARYSRPPSPPNPSSPAFILASCVPFPLPALTPFQPPSFPPSSSHTHPPLAPSPSPLSFPIAPPHSLSLSPLPTLFPYRPSPLSFPIAPHRMLSLARSPSIPADVSSRFPPLCIASTPIFTVSPTSSTRRVFSRAAACSAFCFTCPRSNSILHTSSSSFLPPTPLPPPCALPPLPPSTPLFPSNEISLSAAALLPAVLSRSAACLCCDSGSRRRWCLRPLLAARMTIAGRREDERNGTMVYCRFTCSPRLLNLFILSSPYPTLAARPPLFPAAPTRLPPTTHLLPLTHLLPPHVGGPGHMWRPVPVLQDCQQAWGRTFFGWQGSHVFLPAGGGMKRDDREKESF
ncbi:unnamed protein product, partial [Closterium sp. Naga37s-1]